LGSITISEGNVFHRVVKQSKNFKQKGRDDLLIIFHAIGMILRELVEFEGTTMSVNNASCSIIQCVALTLKE
jgi:hypothetical protein